MIRFAAIGHVTNDLAPDGIVPGGSALYAALAAAELGAAARVVTSHGPDFAGADLLRAVGVDVVARPAEHTTTFVNEYEDGRRRQRLLATAAPLAEPVADADVIFACPVAGEVQPTALAAPPGTVLGAGLQGWLRAVDASGQVSPRRLPDPALFAPCHVLFASDEDLGPHAATVVPPLCEVAEIVIITEGARGARVFLGGRPHRVHAHPAAEVDPTGAGDVFAAAFLLALVRRQPPLEAAVVAACAASVVVEGRGPGALPGLRRLGERLAWYRVNVPPPAIDESSR